MLLMIGMRGNGAAQLTSPLCLVGRGEGRSNAVTGLHCVSH